MCRRASARNLASRVAAIWWKVVSTASCTQFCGSARALRSASRATRSTVRRKSRSDSPPSSMAASAVRKRYRRRWFARPGNARMDLVKSSSRSDHGRDAAMACAAVEAAAYNRTLKCASDATVSTATAASAETRAGVASVPARRSSAARRPARPGGGAAAPGRARTRPDASIDAAKATKSENCIIDVWVSTCRRLWTKYAASVATMRYRWSWSRPDRRLSDRNTADSTAAQTARYASSPRVPAVASSSTSLLWAWSPRKSVSARW